VFVFNTTPPLFKAVIADFGEIGWNGMDWIHLAYDRDQWQALVNTVMNLLGP
jgi:sensor domain CHASE-containing protein